MKTPRRTTPREMNDLNGFQRDLLFVIAGLDEPSGSAVKEQIESYYESEINHGRLYPNLDTLVDKELIEKGKLDQRTNSYSLTSTGERVLEDRREWQREYIEPSEL